MHQRTNAAARSQSSPDSAQAGRCRVRRAGLLIIAAALLPVGCDTDIDSAETTGMVNKADEPQSEQAEGSTPVDPPRWSHPLQAAVGMSPLPMFETQNSPDGRRYSILGGEYDLGDGPVEHDGIVTLERRSTPRPGDPIVEERPKTMRAPAPPRSKISAEVAAEVAVQSDEPIDVVVLGPSPEQSLQWQVERAIASGAIFDAQSHAQRRSALIDERRQQLAAQNQSLAELVETSGGQVTRMCKNLVCVQARVPREAVAALAGRVEVRSIGSGRVRGNPTSPRGLQIRHAAQVKQFIDAGFDGHGPSEGTTTDNVVVAILEQEVAQGATNTGRFHETHPAFRTSEFGAFRNAPTAPNEWRWFCIELGDCQHSDPHSPPYDPANHPTQVAGAILGDYEQSQDPSLDAEERQSASGHAPEAAYHMVIADNANGMYTAVDELLGLPSSGRPPHIINNSHQYLLGCDGDDEISMVMNEAYRSGVAVISAAGNGGGSSTDCRVRSPGAAIGSFTVGAHSNSSDSSATDLRDSAIFDDNNGTRSAWGGNTSQGQNRSIVSMTAPGRKLGQPATDGETYFSSGGITSATSLATALTTGLAADVMDTYFSAGKMWIDHPGRLYSMLLLMGDRQGVSGKRTVGFDHLWGAGRLRARMTKSGGMDSPYYFYHGSTCIDHGEYYYFDLRNGNPLPADINTIKASAFWFDKRHDTTGEVANIDMLLYSDNYSVYRSDTDPDDNKAFTFFDTPDPSFPQSPVHLRIRGTDVQGHSGGCGTDSIMVHWALFAEDGDRESPTYDPVTGEGIAPERE